MVEAGCLRVTHPFATRLYCYNLVRLACIRHAASVHPEPGSNSQIKFVLFLFFLFLKLHSGALTQDLLIDVFCLVFKDRLYKFSLIYRCDYSTKHHARSFSAQRD